MSFISHTSLAFFLFGSFPIHGSEKSEATSADGFTKIFNGENFDGWYHKIRSGDDEQAKKVFTAENGMIHVFNEQFPQEIDLNTDQNATHGMLYTKKRFSHFILRFQYKWGKRIANNFSEWQYDAGCYYHVTNDKIWPNGIEYQIRYNHLAQRNHTGDFWVSGETLDWSASGDGISFLMEKDGGIVIPKKKNELLGSPDAVFHALDDQWNHCEIIVMGKEYAIHKLNGKIINIGRNLSVGDGIIGFQSETAEIFYRNIEIKEFTEPLPMAHFIK